MRHWYIIGLLFFCLPGIAQDYKYYNDAQVWANISLTKRLGKKWMVHLENQDRFHKNVTELRRVSFDVGVTYKFTKNIRARANYRYIIRRNNEGYFGTRHWYTLGLTFKKDVKRFKFFYRNMVQLRTGTVNSDNQDIWQFYDRNKITIKHETTKRISLWVAEEVYVPLNSPQVKGIAIDRSRSYIGTTIKTWKGQDIDFYFMYQAFLIQNNWFDQDPRVNKLPRRDYIYGIGYSIEF